MEEWKQLLYNKTLFFIDNINFIIFPLFLFLVQETINGKDATG